MRASVMRVLVVFGVAAAVGWGGALAAEVSSEPAGAPPAAIAAPQAVAEPMAAGTTAYRFVAGASFHPRDGGTAYKYGTAGSVYVTGYTEGWGFMGIDAGLPHGAVVTAVRLFYASPSDSGCRVFLTRYDGVGGVSDLVFFSAPPAGSITTYEVSVNVPIDTVNYSYVLLWAPDVVGSATKLYGMRVAYTVPPGTRGVAVVPMAP